jgi:hypothetical protein
MRKEVSMSNDTIVAIGEQTTEAVGANREASTEQLQMFQRDEDLSDAAKCRLSEESHGPLLPKALLSSANPGAASR